jgi:single-stranded DNA-binding protein
MNNPNNYPGAEGSIVGTAGGPPETVFDGKTTRLSVAVGEGYMDKSTNQWVDQGTTWYTVQSSTEHAEQNWPLIEKGDKVRVDDARQSVRPYLKNNGDPGVEIRLQYGRITVVDRKSDRQPVSSGRSPF